MSQPTVSKWGFEAGARTHSPSLTELPIPPPNKTGWPWTVETPRMALTQPDGSPWPRISIVTPSYNQGRFIEETIRSVLLQGYPELEYFVIDGGSTDETLEIIRKYQKWFVYWVSEKDRGQAHAINKGFNRASGSIGGYLNSDDMYLEGALAWAARSFVEHRWDLLIGRRAQAAYSPSWRWLRRSWWKHQLNFFPPPFFSGVNGHPVAQESTFWNFDKYRGCQFDESFHICLDPEWYCRIAPGAKIHLTSRRLGFYRHHEDTKTATMQDRGKAEGLRLAQRHHSLAVPHQEYERLRRRLRLRAPITVMRALNESKDNTYSYIHPRFEYFITRSSADGRDT